MTIMRKLRKNSKGIVILVIVAFLFTILLSLAVSVASFLGTGEQTSSLPSVKHLAIDLLKTAQV